MKPLALFIEGYFEEEMVGAENVLRALNAIRRFPAKKTRKEISFLNVS